MDQLLNLRIVSVKDETPVARTYELEEINRKPVVYVPGQFLTFIIRSEKQELRRSYSILSLPGEPLKITVKKVTNGLISRYILQHWHEGDILTSLPPAGRFTLQPQRSPARDIFCFAAGSGIVPLLPQIRHLLAHEPQSVIHLVYSNHNEADTLFLKEIEKLDKHFDKLNLHLLFSEPLLRIHQRGRLSNLTVESLVRRLLTFAREDAVFLICGPFTYMRMLTLTLGLMHFSKGNIRKENFLPEVMRSASVSEPIFPDRMVAIKLFGKEHKILVRSGETILKAAIRYQLDPPYSCEGGVCGTCAAKCKNGKVFMTINEVLTDSELNDGWILTCTGYPAKDGTAIEF